MKTITNSKDSVNVYLKFRVNPRIAYLVDTDDSRFDKTFVSLSDALAYCEELVIHHPEIFINSIIETVRTAFLPGFHYNVD